MSLNRVQPSHSPPAPTSAARSAGVASPDTVGNTPRDTVRLSDTGLLMSRLTEASPPTAEALRRRATALADDLRGLLQQDATPTRGNVGFEVDPHSGDIVISGDTAAPQAIAALMGGRPDIGRRIQDIASLGRLLAASEREGDARRATQAAQIGAVVDDYEARPSGKPGAQDFSRIPGRNRPGAIEAGRILEKYAAASGASDMSAKISLVFDGKDVLVLADGRPWNWAG